MLRFIIAAISTGLLFGIMDGLINGFILAKKLTLICRRFFYFWSESGVNFTPEY